MSSENIYELCSIESEENPVTVYTFGKHLTLESAVEKLISIGRDMSTDRDSEPIATIAIKYKGEPIAIACKNYNSYRLLTRDIMKENFERKAKQKIKAIDGRIASQEMEFAVLCKELERILISHKSYAVADIPVNG